MRKKLITIRRKINHERRRPHAQILRRRWNSHPPANHNPKTHSPRKTVYSTRQNEQASRINENNTRMQNEILLPGTSTKNRDWVTSCPDCIANKKIDTRQIPVETISNPEFTMGPEDCLAVDLPNLPS